MKIAVMQPYLFPYIGYFQLIKAVDHFIFYDDVNFIKNGWINRNRILINGQPAYLTAQLTGASSFKLIKEIEVNKNKQKLIKSIQNSYSKAPYYEFVFPIIERVFNSDSSLIRDLAILSIKEICTYLQINTTFELSSESYSDTQSFERRERLVEICNRNQSLHYINPIGGMDLYKKEDFQKEGIRLDFIQTKSIVYQQFKNDFVPWLSMIDVLMFNSVEEISIMLDNFELI